MDGGLVRKLTELNSIRYKPVCLKLERKCKLFDGNFKSNSFL